VDSITSVIQTVEERRLEIEDKIKETFHSDSNKEK
jgi:hypothetical protein